MRNNRLTITVDGISDAVKLVKSGGYNPDSLIFQQPFRWDIIRVFLKDGTSYDLPIKELEILQGLGKNYKEMNKKEFEDYLLAIRI